MNVRQARRGRASGATAVAVLLLAGMAGCGRSETPAGAGRAAPAPTPAPFRNKVDYVLARTMNAGLRQLRGLALDGSGRLYTASADGIAVFATGGVRLKCWKASAPAHAVAVAEDGTVYAALKDRIEKYDADGRPLGAWGKAGSGPGELSFVTSVAVAGSNVFVGDAGNRCIHRFDTTGDFVNDIGRRDAAAGIDGIHTPSMYLDFAVDSKRVLNVGHPGKLAVERYSADGRLLGSWGKAGIASDAFSGCCNPISVALTPEGWIVTVEKGLPRVKVHDASGGLLAVLGADFVPKDAIETDQSAQPGRGSGQSYLARDFFGDAAVDAQGRIYVASPRSGVVYVFERRGGPAAEASGGAVGKGGTGGTRP